MSWSVFPFKFFFATEFFFGGHFTIEGRQKAIFGQSELGALTLWTRGQQESFFEKEKVADFSEWSSLCFS